MSKKRSFQQPEERRDGDTHAPSVKEVAAWWVKLACGEHDDDLMAMVRTRAGAWLDECAPLNSRYVGVEALPLPATVEELTTAPSPFDFICVDGILDAKARTIMEPHWKGLDTATIADIIRKAHKEGKATRPFDPTHALGFEVGLDDAAARAGASWLCYAITDVGARYQQTYDEVLRQSILVAMIAEKTKAEREQAARCYLSRVWDGGMILFAERHAVVM